jgi:hypothetical protein
MYLRAEHNNQWPITELARVQTTTRKTQDNTPPPKGKKLNQLRLFTLKHEFLKISVDLQTVFAAETRLAARQWLEEGENIVKLRVF